MWTALGFGSGKAAKAPGTFGTLAAVIPVILFSEMPYISKAAVFFVMLVLGTAAAEYHGTYTGVKDASEVVIDEITAFYMIYLFFPVTLMSLAAGFILFRIFDIWKPYPIKKFESLHGGVGVMADDLIAGFYTIISMAVLYAGYIMFFSHT